MSAWIIAATLALGLLVPALHPGAVIRLRAWVLASIAAVSVGACFVLFDLSPPGARLRIDASSDPLLPTGDPARASLERAVEDFGDDEVYVVAVVCDAVFTPRCLEGLERVGDRLAGMQAVRSVSHLMDATRYAYVADDDRIAIEPFMQSVPHDPVELARLEREALDDPVYRRTLISDDARTAALNVRFREMDDGAFIEGGYDAAVIRVLEEELGVGFEVHVAGRPHVKVAVYRGIASDLMRLGPLVALALAAVLGLLLPGLGRARSVALPLGTAALAVLWTHAAIAIAGLSLDLITVLLAPMLLAVASVYGVHVMARFEEERADAGAAAAEAALATLRELRLPSLIACLTTVIGFMALLVSDVPAVRRFGTYGSIGILSATLLALTAIPASLAGSRTPRRPRAFGSAAAEALDAMLSALAENVATHVRGVLFASTLLLVVSVALIPRIVIDTDQLSNFAPDHPVRVDFEAIDARLVGAVPLFVPVDGGAPGAMRDPALLASVAALQAALDDVPGVRRTVSVLDSLRPLNRAFHADDPAHARIPDSRAGVSELLFMLPRNETERLLTLDHARMNVVVRTGLVGSSALLSLADRIEAVLDATPLEGDAEAVLTGRALILARGADSLARSQPLGVALATISIAVLVSVALGSVRLGLATMVPNVVPLIAFYGLMGAGAATLSLPTSLVGSMALGIAVDDSVHYMVRYGRERRAGASPDTAVRLATRRVGRPIAITSLMLVLGFGIVTASEFATLSEFGALAAFTMAACLFADLVLLPSVLLRFRL